MSLSMAHWSLDPLMFVWMEMVAQIRCHKIIEGAKLRVYSCRVEFFILARESPIIKYSNIITSES